MKILIKPIAVILIGVYSFALGQDVYPYYTDPKKQLKFEKERIFIKEVDEKEIVLSGGSQLNFLYLLDQNQPAIVPGDINSSYIYRYSFEMIQNEKQLSEIEILELIGLSEEANKLKNSYKSVLEEYNKNKYDDEDVPYIIYYFAVGPFIFFTYFFAMFGIVITIADEEAGLETLLAIESMAAVTGLVWYGIEKLNDKYHKTIKVEKPIPSYVQTYSNEQLKSLCESYNRRIYEEIKNVN